jgi:hypothetical protein
LRGQLLQGISSCRSETKLRQNYRQHLRRYCHGAAAARADAGAALAGV